ncbi:MAG: hypothetical protein QOK05_565 [Chloroflexota bacterium]|jgi:predicted ATPase/DNA-binding SARP family transcriptional activator|nr:hypothetical protein [Chloroflexota bacterium]
MANLRFRLLGPLELEVDGRPADLGGPRPRAILALLLLQRNLPLDRMDIVDRVWGNDAPATAEHAVEVYISKLRRWTDPGARRGTHRVLCNAPGGYLLRVATEEVDAPLFVDVARRAQAAARRQDIQGAGELAAQALALWRGPALAGLRDFDFTAGAAEQLEELRAGAAELRARALVDLGMEGEAVNEIERLAHASPLREGLVEQLMLVRNRAGDIHGAMAAYHRVRRGLRAELGVEPSERLQALAAEITNAGLVSGSGAHQLVARESKVVVGRRDELDEIIRLLRGRRLVTITGFPGMGKTTLAAEVCRRLDRELESAIHVVDLSAVHDAGDVPDLVARALGLQDQTVRRTTEVLRNFLAGREVLLVLDNCEHLLPAMRVTVADLTAATGVRILATSIVPLGLPGEAAVNIGPLSLPASSDPADMGRSGAVALMRDRLLMADPGFRPGALDLEAMYRICHRLDGLPLAIELAAARSSMLPLHQLADLLDRDLSLVSMRAGSNQARRSLQSALESATANLTPTEKRLLAAAACFHGPIEIDLVLRVAGITSLSPAREAELVEGLISRALLARARVGSEQQLRLLQATRDYTLRTLRPAIVEACRVSYIECFAAECEARIASLEGDGQVGALDWLDSHLDNIRAALRGLLDRGDGERAQAIAGGLGRFWWARGHLTEGRGRLEEALAASGEVSTARAEALRILAYLEWSQGEYDAAQQHCLQALDLAVELDDARSIARSHYYLGVSLHTLGRLDEARATFRKALSAVRALPDQLLEGLVLDMLARSMISAGFQRQARGAHERALKLLQEVGDAFGIAVCLINVGEARERDAEHDGARSAYLEALEQFRALRCVVGEGYALQGLAWIAGVTGDRVEARRLLEAMRGSWDRTGYVPTAEDIVRNAEILGEPGAA